MLIQIIHATGPDVVETLPLDGHEEQTEVPMMNHEEGQEQIEDPKVDHEEGHGQEEQNEVPKVNHEEGHTTADEARYTHPCFLMMHY